MRRDLGATPIECLGLDLLRQLPPSSCTRCSGASCAVKVFSWSAEMNESRGDKRATYSHHLYRCKITDGATENQPNNIAGLEVAKGNSTKKHFTSLTKLQKRITSTNASEAYAHGNSFSASLLSREIQVRECVALARRIKRTAAVCFSPTSGSDENDDLPYVQLDKVSHALMPREAFGPLYLVT